MIFIPDASRPDFYDRFSAEMKRYQLSYYAVHKVEHICAEYGREEIAIIDAALSNFDSDLQHYLTEYLVYHKTFFSLYRDGMPYRLEEFHLCIQAARSFIYKEYVRFNDKRGTCSHGSDRTSGEGQRTLGAD